MYDETFAANDLNPDKIRLIRRLASALALLERKQGGAWEGLILPGSRLPEPSIPKHTIEEADVEVHGEPTA